MHLKRIMDIPAHQSSHGERVQESIGLAAGGSDLYSLATITLPPGKASRLHYHPQAEESYYILSGVGAMRLADETVTIAAGEAVAIPATAVHQISNTSDADLVFLAISVPPWTPDCSIFLD